MSDGQRFFKEQLEKFKTNPNSNPKNGCGCFLVLLGFLLMLGSIVVHLMDKKYDRNVLAPSTTIGSVANGMAFLGGFILFIGVMALIVSVVKEHFGDDIKEVTDVMKDKIKEDIKQKIEKGKDDDDDDPDPIGIK